MDRILSRRKIAAIAIGCAFMLAYMFSVPPEWPGHPFVALVGVGMTAMFFVWH